MFTLRANSFDAIRLCAALFVLAGHSFVLTGNPAPLFLGTGLHVLGVQIFFAISGYLITKSVLRDRRPFAFFVKRALRILPALWICILLTIVLLAPFSHLPVGEYFGHQQVRQYLSNLVLKVNYSLPGVFADNMPSNAVNGSLWSLPAEVMMYGLAFVGVALGRIGIIGITVAFAAFSFMPDSFRHTVVWSVYLDHLPPVGSFFIAGMWLAVLDKKAPVTLEYGMVAFATLFLTTGTPIEPFIRPIATAYFVVALGLQFSNVSARLSQIGDLSYGTYLYAFPVQQAIIALGFAGGSGARLSFIATPIVLTFAAVSWRLIEQPALKWKDQASALHLIRARKLAR